MKKECTHLIQFACIIFLALATKNVLPASPDLTGQWVYNPVKSDEARPKKKNSSIFGKVKPSISIGGWPIPMPGNDPSKEASNQRVHDPDVLYCKNMSIKKVDGIIRATYGTLSSSEFVPGRHRGRVTRWTGKKLTQSYTTTTRKVTQTYQLQKNGDLLVSVTIKPRHASKRVYNRIFDRMN